MKEGPKLYFLYNATLSSVEDIIDTRLWKDKTFVGPTKTKQHSAEEMAALGYVAVYTSDPKQLDPAHDIAYRLLERWKDTNPVIPKKDMDVIEEACQEMMDAWGMSSNVGLPYVPPLDQADNFNFTGYLHFKSYNPKLQIGVPYVDLTTIDQLSGTKDDWEVTARKRTDDNLRKFFLGGN